ncbi:MAG: 30S ribosomal protein S9 [Planctomycetes bacterium]|nr:30S ribosomal protein S9 [Planctomycetota bacterium]
MESASFTWGTGRRKEAIARVRIRKGSGKITVNDTDYEKYFNTENERNLVLSPLLSTKTFNRYDVLARLHGGGKTGQAGALVLGIARALKSLEPALEGKLREDGFLTRDPRMKERKKYGRRGARRSFQFSKR